MSAKITPKNGVTAATRLPVDMELEAKKVAEKSGIRMADLLRIGLKRLLKDVRKNKGVLILGKDQ